MRRFPSPEFTSSPTTTFTPPGRLLPFALVLVLTTACGQRGDDLDDEDIETLSELSGLSTSRLPRSPTNALADNPAAAQLGRRLFFDERMSANQQISCATCHQASHGFSEPRPVSIGVFERRGQRHAPSIWNAGFSEFYFWDGRADSLWSQPLQAIEGEGEMDFTRVEVAHFIAASHRSEYEALFGPLPNLNGIPRRAKPGDQAWSQLGGARQHAVQTVFANVGKALEAYQRRLLCADTRFDLFVRGDIDLSPRERRGARQFLRGGCGGCHNGPNFSDNKFHNIGIPHEGTPDRGRADAIEGLLANPFNGAGVYSDDRRAGQRRLESIASENRQLGAFKTPSLRGVGQRSHFGHLGSFRTLRDIIEHYDRNRRNGNFAGRIDPLMDDVNVQNEGDLEAFLQTLNCPPLSAQLGAP